MSGAVDISKCPDQRRTCQCLPKCKVCGFGMHMAVHGPILGQPPGSQPYDHEFVGGGQVRDPKDTQSAFEVVKQAFFGAASDAARKPR